MSQTKEARRKQAAWLYYFNRALSDLTRHPGDIDLTGNDQGPALAAFTADAIAKGAVRTLAEEDLDEALWPG
jgi:hypothetical protein